MASGPRPCATTPGSGALEPASRAQPGAPASDTDPGRQAARRGGGSRAERAARPRNAASARPRPPRVEQQRRPAAAQGRGDHALERAPPTCGTSRARAAAWAGTPGARRAARAPLGAAAALLPLAPLALPSPGGSRTGPRRLPAAAMRGCCVHTCAMRHRPIPRPTQRDVTGRGAPPHPRSPKPGAVAEARRTWARTRVKRSVRRARAAVGRSLLRRLPRSLTGAMGHPGHKICGEGGRERCQRRRALPRRWSFLQPLPSRGAPRAPHLRGAPLPTRLSARGSQSFSDRPAAGLCPLADSLIFPSLATQGTLKKSSLVNKLMIKSETPEFGARKI